MNIDHVAGAMTGGRPRADFTARVMAPIYGRPRPGFTARVMAQTVAQGFSPASAPAARAFRPAMAAALLVPAAIALVAGVMVLRTSRVELPAPPIAPRLAVAQVLRPANGVAQAPRVAQAVRPATRQPQRPAPAEQPVAEAPEPPPIYMIPALEGPADIAMKSIEPAAFTIPALDVPAPLVVADLPGAPGGSQQKTFKE